MSDHDLPPVADLGHTRLDLTRSARTGMPEAVFAAGKTAQQCIDIVTRLLESDAENASGENVSGENVSDPIIVTRCEPEHIAALAPFAPTAVAGTTLTWRHRAPRPGSVAVVSGGTSDQPVVDECAATLAAYGVTVTRLPDIGVAGLQRLTDALDELRRQDVIVAVAGMEAALATVLAGLVATPIVAVPTSVGYGTTFDGLTALLSLMSSCAPGVAVVGIDNGYGAACAAHRILGAGR